MERSRGINTNDAQMCLFFPSERTEDSKGDTHIFYYYPKALPNPILLCKKPSSTQHLVI
jgi:hypothetical protein